MMVEPGSPTELRKRLTKWYDRNQRDLPWRRTTDPYAIWVSEIMLQQTRVDTVIPYYERFLEEFVDVRALAEADLERVLARWSGLGYYRRARQMHEAARQVVTDFGGRMPATAEGLRKLRGIGDYTAGAIASIAYGESVPIVDGNVIRILSRIFAVPGDMRRTAPRKAIWKLAGQLVPARRPGRFNQAMMELGAMVCHPRSPNCTACPVKGLCEAKRLDQVMAFPELSKKTPPKGQRFVAAVVRSNAGDEVLLAQRRQDGLFGGMWEPPMVPEGQSVRASFGKLGVDAARLESRGRVAHTLSHRALDIEVRCGRCEKRPLERALDDGPYAKLGWRQVESVPLSTLARKVLKMGALALLAFASVNVETSRAMAAEATGAPAARADEGAEDDTLTAFDKQRYAALSRSDGRYARVLTSLSVGGGLRLNNPFRLSTQLGQGPESLSAIAPFIDAGLGVTFGQPDGWQHGGALRLSAAVEGVNQQAVGIGYLGLYRAEAPFMVSTRLGASILTAPNPNVGGEVALAGAWFFTGAIGVQVEAVGALYYGAGLYEKVYTVVPVIAGQLGLVVDYEVLP